MSGICVPCREFDSKTEQNVKAAQNSCMNEAHMRIDFQIIRYILIWHDKC